MDKRTQLTCSYNLNQAGGAALDALRSIVISQMFLGTTEVLVVKHTKCGMIGLKNDMALEVVESKLG
jgi:carbonic anhydrase